MPTAGDAVAGATVIAGRYSEFGDPVVSRPLAMGVSADPESKFLKPQARTVTIAKKCYQPITFIVSVPVDTVTAYLDPVLSHPSALKTEIPPGTGGVDGGGLSGSPPWSGQAGLARVGVKEFRASRLDQRAAAPESGGAAKRVAYVFKPLK